MQKCRDSERLAARVSEKYSVRIKESEPKRLTRVTQNEVNLDVSKNANWRTN